MLRRREQAATLLAAALVLLACSVAPLALLVAREGPAWTAAFALLGRSSALALLARSVALSGSVVIVALALGVPMGVVVARMNATGVRFATLLHAFPVFLPPFLLSLGWFHIWGTAGVAGSETTSNLLFSGAGVIAVQALAFAPVATVLVAIGLLSVDPSLEEAARAVARPARVVREILLPAAAPAWRLAAIVIFTLSFSDLGVPMFLRVDTFPAAVFSRLGGIDYAPAEALGLVLPLLPLCLLLLVLERRFAGARSYAVLGLRTGRRDSLPLGRWRVVVSTWVWALGLVSAAPLVALAWRAGAAGFSQVGRWLGRAPWNSVATAAAAATVIVAIGLVVGHAAARRQRGAAALDMAAVLAFAAPAALLGVGLIALWNRPRLQWVYGTAGILVVGYVARYAVIGIRTIGCLVAQTPVLLEEAAAAAGAGFWRRVGHILLPLHRRGIGFAWLLAAVCCLRDLELPVLFYPPGGEPLAVRIFTLEANGPEPVVAALALVHVVMTAAVVAAGGWLLRSRAP